MRCFAAWCGFLVLCLLGTVNGSPLSPDSSRVSALVTIQQLLFDDQFDSSKVQIDTYIRVHPDDPGGYLFRASWLLARMSDQEEKLYPAEFKGAIDTVRLLARRADTVSARNRAWMYLWLGHAKAYESVYESRFGSLADAIGLGFDAKGEYEKGLSCDSTVTDLYFGLGSYHYWKSAKAGILRWLGIFRNDKERGIGELRRAAAYSEISREVSQNQLIWVYFDNDQADSAIALALVVTAKYPHGKSLLWPLAKGYFDGKRFREAIEVYSRLRSRYAAEPGNYFNLIECDFYLARSYEQLGDKNAARQCALKLGEYYDEVSKVIRRRQQSKLGHLKHLAGAN